MRPAPAPAPFEAPRPPLNRAEQGNSPVLLPDESARPGGRDPEELSGSLLIEDDPDGGAPVVTRLDAAGSPLHPAQGHGAQAPEPYEPAHRALLGMPDLPKTTPGPSLGTRGQTAQHRHPPASDEPVYTDAQGAEAYAEPGGSHEQQAYAEAPYSQAPSSYEEGPVYRAPIGRKNRIPLPVAKAIVRGKELAKEGWAKAEPQIRSTWAKAQKLAREQSRGRPPWMVPAVLGGGLVVGIAVASILFAATSKHDDTDAARAAAKAGGSASASAGPSMPTAATAAAAARRAAPGSASQAKVAACTVSLPPHVLAPAAIVPAGIEVRPLGDSLAVGFASSEHEAHALRVDPGSLASSGDVTSRTPDPIRRVRPVAGAKDTLGLVVDADKKRDHIQGRRTLPIDPPLQVGASGGNLVWARAGAGPSGSLWALPGPDDIDAVRAASEGEPGETTTAIAFRRSNAVWIGVVSGYRALTPKGDITHIAGLGSTVGSPAVAVNEGAVVVAWSDRASADVPWHIRMIHTKPGELPGEPVDFRAPSGGPGGHVMSPGLAAVPGGRFLLVWTEGPTSQQRVRAVTLTSSGEPVGKALEISNEAVNSGQGQAAVTATGAKGVVAFLQVTGDGFQVVATGIACNE
jgi:hypothetical protein